MAKTVFEISMTRPDRKRKVNRVLIADNVRVSSDIQEAGFVTHSVYKDSERGGPGTHYTLKATKEDGSFRMYTVRKDEYGRYRKC